ncbi:hypothetical protein [Nocardioides sp.]|uniref:hypothetical protein n=1 Tax=Nocardioides sp. TaxID=35761 RepID=UPI003510DD25
MSQMFEDGEAERISVRYDGPAVDHSSMDVRLVAPSLLALADLFAVAHSELGPTLTPPPRLEIIGQRSGSLIIDMLLAAESTLVDLLNHERATAVANGLALSAPVIGAITWVVHRKRMGRESGIEPVGSDIIRVTWPDGTTLLVPVGSQALIERMDFNRTAVRVFEPLREDGIDEVELNTTRSGRAIRASVRRDDLAGFNLPPGSDLVLSDGTRTVTVRIESLPLKMGNKWRVHDGLASLWATLDDVAFAQLMEAGSERFGVDDRLVVLMRDRQLRSGDGVGESWEHSILKVIEHKSAPPPDELPFDDE